MKVKQLPEGTIFRFTNPDARGRDFTYGPWDQLCVVLFDGELGSCYGCYRRISANRSHAGVVKTLPLDSIEIVGLMPKSSQGATTWDDSFYFPHGMKPGTVFQFKTQPRGWNSDYNWTTRMVVMFPEANVVSRHTKAAVRFRRMPKDMAYTSEWDPTSDEFEIVGHLTPDQLHSTDESVVTDSTVGLEPEVNEEGVDETPVVDPRFTEGTVFRLTSSKPSWWVSQPKDWNEPCVVLDLDLSNDGAVPFRLLSRTYRFDSFHFFPEVDEFEIIGQMPPNKFDSTNIRDVRNTQYVEKEAELALGTKFRFNKIPERWRKTTNAEVGNIFSVIENSGFTGVGQCVSRTAGPWWSASDGVLPTDDIEIVGDEVVEYKSEELELKLALGTKFRFISRPDRWSSSGPFSLDTVFKVVEYKDFNGEGQAVQREVSTCPWCSADGVLPSDDIEIFEDELVQIPVGTKFRFTEIPDRWGHIPEWVVADKTEFEVIECEKFNGEGQCLSILPSNSKIHGNIYSYTNGVLSTDDIDIEILDKSSDRMEDDMVATPQPLPVGTKFSFNTVPSRWQSEAEGITHRVFEVVANESFSGKGQCVSDVDLDGNYWNPTDGVLSTDDISIAEVEGIVHPVEQLSLGTQLRFNKFPDRWNYRRGDASTIFEVVEAPTPFEFVGKGQAIKLLQGTATASWYSDRDGVLPSDDIEILEVVDDRLADHEIQLANERTARLKKQQKQEVERLVAKIQDLEKENGQLKGTLVEWQSSYYEARRTIKKLREKKPNAAIAFFKRIW